MKTVQVVAAAIREGGRITGILTSGERNN